MLEKIQRFNNRINASKRLTRIANLAATFIILVISLFLLVISGKLITFAIAICVWVLACASIVTNSKKILLILEVLCWLMLGTVFLPIDFELRTADSFKVAWVTVDEGQNQYHRGSCVQSIGVKPLRLIVVSTPILTSLN